MFFMCLKKASANSLTQEVDMFFMCLTVTDFCASYNSAITINMG